MGAPTSSLTDVVVVGTSLAGLRAAEELRRQGYRGALTMIGREQHFPPYDRPPLSKEVLRLSWAVEAARLRQFEELDATLQLGRSASALRLDGAEVELSDGEVVSYRGLIIATGADVRRLRCPGADLPGVFCFRDVEDCLQVRERIGSRPRVTVIGAGFIGSEVAASCREHGLDLTMLDAATAPMQPQVGARLAAYLMQQHRDHGIDVRLGEGVAGFVGDGRVEAVELTDGSRIDTDLVIVGVGVQPATQWLAGSGLVIDDGVLCDEHCVAVGAANVVAAGDVARWTNPVYGRSMRVEHWTNAIEQAEYAARSLLDGGTGPGYTSVPYFWSDQYDMHLQFAGICGEEDEVIDGSIDERRFVLESRTAGRVVGVVGVNWPARFQRCRRELTTAGVPVTP